MFIVSVIVSKVAQLSHLQFLHQMFNVSTLLLEGALKPATPLTNGAINETLRHEVIFDELKAYKKWCHFGGGTL